MTGRRTGRRIPVPLVYLRDRDRYVIAASYAGADRHPDWWLNLQAHPDATIEVLGQHIPVRATTAGPAEHETLWPQLVRMYPPFHTYEQRTTRRIPVIILTPVP